MFPTRWRTARKSAIAAWSREFITIAKPTGSPGSATLNQEGNEHFQKAKAVIVSGYAIETPRLLLNSACDGYENGLANSSDTVGRYLMAQAGNVILGPVRRTGPDVQSAARPRTD